MPKESCLLDGVEFSEGAEVCQEGTVKRCIDGKWVDLGRECHDNEIKRQRSVDNHDTNLRLVQPAYLTLVEPAFPEVEIVSSTEEISRHRLSKLVTGRCFNFAGSGSADKVPLGNSCDHKMMATVRWVDNSGYMDLKYRLPQYSHRWILFHGSSAGVIDEKPWDFMYGDDARQHVALYSQLDQGWRIWYLNNRSFRYICFKVDLREDGEYKGFASGIAEPGVTMSVFPSPPGVISSAFINSARFEPD